MLRVFKAPWNGRLLAKMWSDEAVKELLSLRAEHTTMQQLNGTARDSLVFAKMVKDRAAQGVIKTKAQGYSNSFGILHAPGVKTTLLRCQA